VARIGGIRSTGLPAVRTAKYIEYSDPAPRAGNGGAAFRFQLLITNIADNPDDLRGLLSTDLYPLTQRVFIAVELPRHGFTDYCNPRRAGVVVLRKSSGPLSMEFVARRNIPASPRHNPQPGWLPTASGGLPI